MMSYHMHGIMGEPYLGVLNMSIAVNGLLIVYNTRWSTSLLPYITTLMTQILTSSTSTNLRLWAHVLNIEL